MAERLPLLFDMAEVERLHEIARIAALQAVAKPGEPGGELDHVTAEIFATLAMQANRTVLSAQTRPPLRLIEGG